MKVLLAFLLCLAGLTAFAAEPGFKMNNIVLYQPNEVLTSRVREVATLTDYIKKIEAECASFFAKETKAEFLHIVVAVKPGKQARVWFVAPGRKDMKSLAPLHDKLEKIPAAEVFAGPVAFALAASLAGGKPAVKPADEGFSPPIPTEWEEAVKGENGSIQLPEGFLAKVWPDAPADPAKEVPAPEGFVNQVLEPTGGRIFRPKDWHYTEAHAGPRYMWTISKEDISKGDSYTTGVRIQSFLGVKEKTQQTPREFIENFVAEKKKSADRVIKTCDAKDMGLFTRICIEVEEGPHHVLYSLFWGNNGLDMAVVAISGTTKELWKDFSATFDTMSAFELIDMKRFEKSEAAGDKK